MRTSRASIWRLLVTLIVLGAAGAFIYFEKPNLGLDLRGGTRIEIQTESTDKVKADAASTDRTVTLLRGRIDALGVSEPTIVRSGNTGIIVELPNVQDPQAAQNAIGQTAVLEFHEVLAAVNDPSTVPPTPGVRVVPTTDGRYLVIADSPLVSGEDIKDANATTQAQGVNEWVVNVNFSSQGQKNWKKLVSTTCANQSPVYVEPTTSQPVSNVIAIVLDGTVISYPQLQPDLCASGGGASTQITGKFDQRTADQLAVLIKGGALPLKVNIVSTNSVGPTLGSSAIHASILASIIGLILTGLFIIWNYRGVGLMATIALGCYAVISYGALIGVGATLTLPGLAGFVLAIGLAIDANVLVYERAREEYDENPGSGLLPALDTGYAKAFSAIIDSNVTTVIAAMLLFFFAAGPVQGFGVTLTIGVLASMVSALVIARLLTDWLVSRKFIRSRPKLSGIGGISRVRKWLNDHGPYLLRHAGRLAVVSLAVAAVMIGGILVRGLDLGVDFSGGRQLEYSTAKSVSPDKVRTAVADAGFPDAIVQTASSDGKKNIAVRVHTVSNKQAEQIRLAVESVGGKTTQVSSEQTGASLGKDLRNKALLAFAIAIAAMMAYLAWRFRWTWAIAAIVSMASVVLAVVGIFAWWGKTIDSVFLAAILSVIGLSVNDTIVVFDRIRERLALGGVGSVRELTNEAILSTVPRTINTALGATFILSSLVIFGGDSLRDFSIAVLLGLIIGHLSTVFTAAPLGVLLEEKWPHNPTKAKAEVDPYAFVRNK